MQIQDCEHVHVNTKTKMLIYLIIYSYYVVLFCAEMEQEFMSALLLMMPNVDHTKLIRPTVMKMPCLKMHCLRGEVPPKLIM